jgi:hypothetical protein
VEEEGPCGYSVSSRVCDMAPKLIATQDLTLNQNPQDSLQPDGTIVVLAGLVLFVVTGGKRQGDSKVKFTLKSHAPRLSLINRLGVRADTKPSDQTSAGCRPWVQMRKAPPSDGLLPHVIRAFSTDYRHYDRVKPVSTICLSRDPLLQHQITPSP